MYNDTEPQVAGAATEPPLPLAVDASDPQFVTIAIVIHDNEVLHSLACVGPVNLDVNDIGTDNRKVRVDKLGEEVDVSVGHLDVVDLVAVELVVQVIGLVNHEDL